MTSSMHHDLQRGNQLEVQWLSGGVVQLGSEVGYRRLSILRLPISSDCMQLARPSENTCAQTDQASAAAGQKHVCVSAYWRGKFTPDS